ncbi:MULTISPECIES: hypothetical protein [Methylobacterium]|uniref:Fe-S oxidoreductase n=2 Tax=Methylobacterium TaxID=407 RepID=A0A0C6FXR3_9HYPH|nr:MULTISPECIES: hypothetical protein [Methylobacterium]BAQ48125.1 hypothetical protein Maq22A_c26270 [Methylobacterium aquaticum]
MRAGLMLGLTALGILAAASPAEAKGRRGGFSFIARSHAAPAGAPAAAEAPRLRTASADGPEPMTTGTTAPPAPRVAAPAPAPSPAPAKPWCTTGRVFGSGAGFCAIN